MRSKKSVVYVCDCICAKMDQLVRKEKFMVLVLLLLRQVKMRGQNIEVNLTLCLLE